MITINRKQGDWFFDHNLHKIIKPHLYWYHDTVVPAKLFGENGNLVPAYITDELMKFFKDSQKVTFHKPSPIFYNATTHGEWGSSGGGGSSYPEALGYLIMHLFEKIKNDALAENVLYPIIP